MVGVFPSYVTVKVVGAAAAGVVGSVDVVGVVMDVAVGVVDAVVVEMPGLTRVTVVVVGAGTATVVLNSLCEGTEVDDDTIVSGESSIVVDGAEEIGTETSERVDDSGVSSFIAPNSNVKTRVDPMMVVITATPKGEVTALRAVRMPGAAMRLL